MASSPKSTTSRSPSSPEPMDGSVGSPVWRPTQSSMSRCSPSRPSDIAAPPSVAELARLSPMERVKKEYAENQHRKRERKSRAGFNTSTHRNLGLLPDATDTLTEHQQRAMEEQKRRHEEKLRKVQTHSSAEGSQRPASPSDTQPSWFLKSANFDRHSFQRVWPSRGFPQAAVQKIFTPAAPGPGAYLESTSFIKINN